MGGGSVVFFAVWAGCVFYFAVWAGPRPPPKQQKIKHAPAQTAKTTFPKSPNNKNDKTTQKTTLLPFRRLRVLSVWFRDFQSFTVPGLQGSGVFEVKDEKSMVFFCLGPQET